MQYRSPPSPFYCIPRDEREPRKRAGSPEVRLLSSGYNAGAHTIARHIIHEHTIHISKQEETIPTVENRLRHHRSEQNETTHKTKQNNTQYNIPNPSSTNQKRTQQNITNRNKTVQNKTKQNKTTQSNIEQTNTQPNKTDRTDHTTITQHKPR